MTADEKVKDLLVGADQLFSLPDIYFQLNEMITDPRFTLTDIGQVIAKDPSLAIRLLRVVNSSFYGFQSKIDTISRAIAVVGIEEVQDLVLATTVVDQFERIPSELVDMTAFWLHSIHCGVVAKLLAKESLVLHSERLFLAGLLHDIGSLVLYQKMPDQSHWVLQAANHDRRLLGAFEQELLGFTHADVGRELIKSWGLPESLYEPIGCYLHPDEAESHRLDAYIINMASRLVESTERGVPPEYLADEFSTQTLTLLRLTRKQLVSVMEKASVEFASVFDMMAPSKRFH
jgi:HD-like signal output (HDOD) protein